MKQLLINLSKFVLKRFDVGFTRYGNLQSLKEYENDINAIAQLPNNQLERIVPLLTKSRSQCKQDLFALAEVDFKRSGYFVEFGATNGIEFSNTYLLETEFGWNGILAEPARCWHKELRENRNCNIEPSCVWRDSGSTLNFNEVNTAGLSTISAYSASDSNRSIRKSGKNYEVDTISLLDLLDKYHAPKEIDYLSIDTEGSEFDILKSFDFNKYRFKVITCEHNFTPMRERIFELLTRNGYVRKYTGLSKWDDWFVR